MPDTPKVTIIKHFLYRGVDEQFSNTYHFSGTTPATPAAWRTLVDAIVVNEKPTVTSAVSWVGAYGYEAGSPHADWTLNYIGAGESEPFGSMTLGSMIQSPGDDAVTLRWATGTTNMDGKPIYLRKYMHPAYFLSGAPDTVASTQRTAMGVYAGKWTDGSLPGGVKVCKPQGGDGAGAFVSPFVTTRTLKRRGKRPSS